MEIQNNVTLIEDTNESESLFDHEVRLRPKVESVSIASIEHSWANLDQNLAFNIWGKKIKIKVCDL